MSNSPLMAISRSPSAPATEIPLWLDVLLTVGALGALATLAIGIISLLGQTQVLPNSCNLTGNTLYSGFAISLGGLGCIAYLVRKSMVKSLSNLWGHDSNALKDKCINALVMMYFVYILVASTYILGSYSSNGPFDCPHVFALIGAIGCGIGALLPLLGALAPAMDDDSY